jgi:hypothetical protein
LEALLTYRTLSGTFDLSQSPALKKDLQKKIDSVQHEIDSIESELEAVKCAGLSGEEKVEKTRALNARKEQIRKQNCLPTLARNVGLLANVQSIMSLCPSVIDYAVNVGLRETSDQWVAFLNTNGNLRSDLALTTKYNACFPELMTEGLETNA